MTPKFHSRYLLKRNKIYAYKKTYMNLHKPETVGNPNIL